VLPPHLASELWPASRIDTRKSSQGERQLLLVVPVQLGGAAKTFVLTHGVKGLASALVRGRAMSASPVSDMAMTAAAEVRAWARRHAVPVTAEPNDRVRTGASGDASGSENGPTTLRLMREPTLRVRCSPENRRERAHGGE
jgi:hypothetical protein